MISPLWRSLLLAALIVPEPGQLLARTDTQAERSAPQPAHARPDGAHDFDFEFGMWKAHIARRMKPLSGSAAWTEYDGTSVVHKLWGGRANVGELDVTGPTGLIEGMSLRLYDPQARQWKIRWANGKDGDLGAPMIGGFENGRGAFYDQEMFDGRAILVRFIFSSITRNSFRIEQAFSDDGGKSWEVNWIADFAR
jgi:hypothetical protein